jgi:hypothetical protein
MARCTSYTSNPFFSGHRPRALGALVTLAVAVLITACGGGGGTSAQSITPEISPIAVLENAETPAVPAPPVGAASAPSGVTAEVVDPVFTSDSIAPSPFAKLDSAATAVDHLLKAPKPRFREGSKLPALTTSSFGLNSKLDMLIAQDFGYGLNVSQNADLLALARSNPGKYSTYASFQLQYFRPDSIADNGKPYYKQLSADPFLQDGKGVGVPGDPANPQSDRVLRPSPLVPDADWLLMGRQIGERLRADAGGVPISIIQNYGEYGSSGNIDAPLLAQDPKVAAAHAASGLEWFSFLAREKVRGERLLKKGLLEALGQKTPPLYIYYTDSFNFSRGSYYTWRDYASDYAESAKAGFPVSDMPNDQTYYEQFNSGFTGTSPLFAGDMFTQLLNTVAGNRSMGDLRPMYLWASAGWEGQGGFAEPERFMGFLKAAYTLGVQTTVAGYYCGPNYDGTVNPICPNALAQTKNLAAVGASPAQWLWPIMLQGHAHALFSHLEGYLNKGDVIHDGRQHPFVASIDVGLPLLELAVEKETARVKSSVGIEIDIPTARVVARKLKDENRFLITAWANTGDDRIVNVTVPGLGRVSVNARKSGAVYLGTISNGQPNLKLVDENGMNPTARLSTVVP